MPSVRPASRRRYKRLGSGCVSGGKSSHPKARGEAGRNARSQGMMARSGVIRRRENPTRQSCDEQKYMFQCVTDCLFPLAHGNTAAITSRLTSEERVLLLLSPRV